MSHLAKLFSIMVGFLVLNVVLSLVPSKPATAIGSARYSDKHAPPRNRRRTPTLNQRAIGSRTSNRRSLPRSEPLAGFVMRACCLSLVRPSTSIFVSAIAQAGN